MIEMTLDIVTKGGGEMETFICHPERNGPFSAVFLLMDAYGVREELKDMARRFGTIGYYVLLPNLYYRAGRDTIYVAGMLAFVERQREVKSGPVGCHGYCMSGPYALAAAARYPDQVAAAASFYGTWLISEAEESPHLSLGKVEGELST